MNNNRFDEKQLRFEFCADYPKRQTTAAADICPFGEKAND